MRPLEQNDLVVLGAGVVGLSVARSAAQAGRRVLVIEPEIGPGRGGSSRSSGVIHAGLHHPSEWLKSRLARRGRSMLYAFCARHGVPCQKTGKLIVAQGPEEIGQLEALAARAAGLRLDARMLSSREITEEEPNVKGHAALSIAETGVVRVSELVRALALELEAMGGEILIGVSARELARGDAGLEVRLLEGPTLRAAQVVVAAGIDTDGLLARSGIDVESAGLVQTPCKGEWVALSERHRKAITRHIYPLPSADGSGLGVHLTRDVDGYLHAGPDVTWLERPDYTLSPDKVAAFGEALRRFYPNVHDGDLHPMMAGVRTKLSKEGQPPRDFLVWEGRPHGWPGLTALLGIESPGLTACLALGEHVAGLLGAED